MAIEPNATIGELDSPFFLKNKTLCDDFETYIVALGGVTTGSYNAWSYNVKGRVDSPLRWVFQLVKATYSSGNLLISTKKQSLQFWTIWKCKKLETGLPDFIVRKKKFGDFFRRITSKSVNEFQRISDYTIISQHHNHLLANRLRQILQFYFSDHSLLKMTYQNNELIIQIDTDQILKNKFEELMREKFTGL